MKRMFILRTLAGITLTAAAFMGCSSGGSASTISQSLADRLTDNLGFEEAVSTDGTPPASNSNELAISSVTTSENWQLGSTIGVTLTTSYTGTSPVAAVVVRVEGASKYLTAPANLESMLTSIFGVLGTDAALKGKTFRLTFALQNAAGQTGPYSAAESVYILDSDPLILSRSAITMGSEDSGGSLHETTAPSGSTEEEAPQIVDYQFPESLASGDSFLLTLYTRQGSSGGSISVVLALSGVQGWYELPGALTEVTTRRKSGDGSLLKVVVGGQFPSSVQWPADGHLTYKVALKSGHFTGLYRPWCVRLLGGGEIIDGDAEYETDGEENIPTGFPIPIITMAGSIEEKECSTAVIKEPLTQLTIFGCDSESPSGNYPLEYWWEIVEKPDQAVDTQLICATCSVDDPNRTVVENQWTSECKPKMYVPLSGNYRVKLKVRDSRNIESDDANNTETCPWAYLTINVVPSKKVYVQLAWDKGDKVNKVDLDLFLAQYRECGTMGVKMPSLDKVKAPVASFPTTCQKDSDCQGLPCKPDNTCDTSCSTDADCKVGHPGWICTSENTCSEASGQIWACDTDADCLGEGYCTPKDLSNCAGDKICTLHTPRQINDSCHFENRYKVDFGEVCDPTDNGGLDLDDVDGYGPETISIAEPANGTYRAVVRVYNDVANQLSTSDPVTAYLTVYVSGQPCPTLSMVFDAELMYWKAVDIEWVGEGTTCAQVNAVALNPANAGDSTANQCRDTNDCSALGVDPKYANPYRFASSLFDPCHASYPRSVWCDSAADPDCDTSCCSSQ